LERKAQRYVVVTDERILLPNQKTHHACDSI
jgi:hypothetical protein